MDDPRRWLIPLVQEAGRATLAHHGERAHTTKDDGSPLTAADLASEAILLAGLRARDPATTIVSEEGAEIPDADRAWLVDPLDGTKEFLGGNGDFTVNVGLVERGEPVVGAVHVPVLGTTYFGVVGSGAWRIHRDEVVAIRARPLAAIPAIVASRSHPDPMTTKLVEKIGEHTLVERGSSLKLCLLAEGSADLYPRGGPTMEWDTAAAHAVLRAAGGEIYAPDGAPLRYGKPGRKNTPFLAVADPRRAWPFP